MNARSLGRGLVATVAVVALVFAGCSGESGSGAATASLASVPHAEVFIDGKASGTTPLDVALAVGKHDLVFRQVGFEDRTESIEVSGGTKTDLDVTLIPRDPTDPDAIRLLAAALDVETEPVVVPEIHRGAGMPDVVLMWPRNDVRREGLASWRVDVSPAYEGGGSLEFRKGRTVFHKQAFDPETLVTTGQLPAEVLQAVKVGDTVTWGVWFADGRKAITAQFEVVNKPQADKKLEKLMASKHVRNQPPVVQEMLKAEALQSYRLYSEALVTFLDIKAADRESVVPNGGIVSCLRRMDLEDTALYMETASRTLGKGSRGNAPGAGVNVPSRRPTLATTPPALRTPGGAAPSTATGPRMGGSVPSGMRTPAEAPGAAVAPPATTPSEPGVAVPGTGGVLAGGAQDLEREATEARNHFAEIQGRAEEADQAAAAAREAAGAAESAAREAEAAAAAAATRFEESGSDADRTAAETARTAADAAQRSAQEAARAATESARVAGQVRGEANRARELAEAVTARLEAARQAAAVGNPPPAPGREAPVPPAPQDPVPPTPPEGGRAPEDPAPPEPEHTPEDPAPPAPEGEAGER